MARDSGGENHDNTLESARRLDTRLDDVRRRALRAARAVALAGSLTLGIAGCGARAAPTPQDAGLRADTTIKYDTTVDIAVVDKGVVKDATVDQDPCNSGCGTPGCPCVGPFVPPEMPA